MGVGLAVTLLASTPFDVALFVPEGEPEIVTAIAAQLSGLEVRLERLPEPIWQGEEMAQLRQVRAALLGTRVRVAVWLERAPRQLHVTDLWTSRHFVRSLSRDGSEPEAAGLIVRGAVQAFLSDPESAAAMPPEASESQGSPAASVTASLAALWQTGSWAGGIGLTQAPRLDARLGLAKMPLSARLSASWELPVILNTEAISLRLQRTDFSLSAEYVAPLGRWVALRPSVGLGLRLYRSSTVALAEGVTAASPATDVAWSACGALTVSVRVFGPFLAVVTGGVQVPLGPVRYLVQGADSTTVVLQGWGVEPQVAAGIAAELF